ncbi:hypothetical protein M885DRAFT_508091 [Pelagophyceae sp. CCMP2097]|nr:hypothetical protein M885DRAFT_508091 [Pelagophyceae sp. CCMP2097]
MRVGGTARAQWLADWRVIAESFAKLPQPGFEDMERSLLARALGTACSDELEFMPAVLRKSAKSPSPFALALVDACFCAAHTRPDVYARLREYVLGTYVPARGADVFSLVGATRVAAAARARASPRPAQMWYDPGSPEYRAFVLVHNVEYAVKHSDWRQRITDLDLDLNGPCD